MKRRQQGLATLATVTGVLLVATLAALQLGRGQVLELRSARHQVAAAQAAEAADAGLEWALAHLSTDPVDDACTTGDDATRGPRARAALRDRWLQAGPGGVVTATGAAATCIWRADAWRCACTPAGGDDATALPSPPEGAAALAPAFRVRAETVAGAPAGVVRLRAVGCSAADAGCLADGGAAPALEARAAHSLLVARASVLPNPPGAAVTVRGRVTAESATLRAVQPDGSRSGVALAAGGAARGAKLAVVGPPGAPPGEALRAEAASIPAHDRQFAAAFLAAWPERWRAQPAVVAVDCSSTCDAATLRRLTAAHPGRPLWLRGPVRLDGPVGSADAPAMLMCDGPVQVDDAEVIGLLWLREATLAAGASALLRGALIAEGDLVVTGGGALTAVHDGLVLERIRAHAGSWARVPGGWRDE